MLLITLCFLLNIVYTNGSYIFNYCDDYSQKNSCVTQWNCMWCNNSFIENNTIIHSSSCNRINPCFISQENNKNCIYNFQDKYELQCKVGRILTYLFLLFGFYLSILIIYGTLNKVVLRDENTSTYVRRSLNTMIFILTTVPLVVAFFTDQLIFNFLFLSYIISAACIYCCIEANNYKSHFVKATPYTQIN